MRALGPTSACGDAERFQQLFGKADAAPVDRRDEAGHVVVRTAQARTARSIDAPERKARVIMPISCASASPSRTTARNEFARRQIGPMGDQVALERLEILEMPVETAPRHAETGGERLRLERRHAPFRPVPRGRNRASPSFRAVPSRNPYIKCTENPSIARTSVRAPGRFVQHVPLTPYTSLLNDPFPVQSAAPTKG
jgi:hypothetical protein